MKNLRFAYLSINDPQNKKVWSGTHYSIFRSLKELGEVEVLGPYEPKWPVLICKILNQLSLRIAGKRISYRHGIWLSKIYAKHFAKQLKGKSFDYIVAPAASQEVAFLNTTIPVIYISDGTFASCLNYHKSLTNLTTKSIIEGNLIEKLAIEKSKKVIVSSEWAAKSVIHDYGKNKSDVFVIPFGANFDLLPSEKEVEFTMSKPFKLLFVGVYWQSKGGDIAYNAYKILHEKGFAVSLTVVGCEPPADVKHEHLQIISFIDKNSAEGQQKLSDIYKAHYLLLLPTRFDCTPIVINEASAFGIPSLVSNSGGVEGHLKTNANGYLIDYNDTGKGFADTIEKLILNPQIYLDLRKSSRQLYNSTLNWQHWTTAFIKAIGD